ncbi:MAG: LysE family translocator [Acidiferrobacterales bacterium]|nr:LysE family translocator [Acidiferrobacterales bacterium]
MTLSALLALFAGMFIAAAIPGPGVLVVVARSLSQGFKAGAITAFGVICGDFVLICLTVIGLTSLSGLLGGFFDIIKYLGGAYLIWLGINLIRSGLNPASQTVDKIKHESLSASFFAGFVTTLSNPKAIFFYASLFPNMITIASLTIADFLLIEIVAVSAVGSVMLGYAFITSQSKQFFAASQSSKYLQIGVGGIFIATGIYIMTRA